MIKCNVIFCLNYNFLHETDKEEQLLTDSIKQTSRKLIFNFIIFIMAALEEVVTLKGHLERVWHVSWSPNGASLASCGGDKVVRIWGKEGMTF